jgi:alpha-tubulin suppressor-like RCC1 family protein
MKSQEADASECGHRLRRKVVICEVEDDRHIQVRHVLETSGFNCAPQIKYGENNDSKIWINKKTTASNGPVLIKLMTPSILQLCIKSQVKLLSCGFEHCVLLTDSGRVASWGCGASGSLGHGNYLTYTEPNLIASGDFSSHSVEISYIECGGYHSGAIDNAGNLYMWGRSDVG